MLRAVTDSAAVVMLVAVAAPMFGVTSVGEVANTSAPLPVSSVTAEARLADDGVARKAATPVPSPLTPVAIGSPVQFVSVPDEGVPKAQVTKVADVSVPPPVTFPVTFPVTLPVTAPVNAPTNEVAVTVVSVHDPLALVRIMADGVPNAGVTSVGLVALTSAPVPVAAPVHP